MDPQDQDNFDDESSSSSMDDVDLADESPIDNPAGSASSSRNFIVKIKNFLPPENSAADTPPPPPPPVAAAAAIIKSHHCKLCNKSFSSGKALGGHMSSAHVQANKDYSFKKQKPRSMKDYPSGSGPGDYVCNECGKPFFSKKSLYGHMRCHPDRDYRGMVEPRMDQLQSSQASTDHPGLRYTARQLDRDNDDEYGADSSSGPDALSRLPPENFAGILKAWPATAKRGRSSKPGNVSPPASFEEEEVEEGEITAGHQLLRLLDRNPDSGVKIGGAPAPEIDQVMNSKERGGGEAYHGPDQASGWDEARDCKRPKKGSNNPSPKLKIWNTNGRIMDDVIRKGKDKVVDDDEDEGGPENEEELLLGAISVLANGKRELCGRPPVPENYYNNNSSSPGERLVSPKKENSGLTSLSLEKNMCCTCKKVFSSHQALGGHRSSHKKLTVSIINTADEINGGDHKKAKMKNVANGGVGVKIDGGGESMVYPCKVCDKVFPTGRALGGHKKCHNNYNNNNNNNNNSSGNIIVGDDRVGNDKDKDSDAKGGGGEEKAVRGFDLNMMPDDENQPDGDFAGL